MFELEMIMRRLQCVSSGDAVTCGLSVAVLIPCYNEAVTISKVVADFRRELPAATIYVYDNNSTDDAAGLAAMAGAVVRKEPRQGKGNVVRSMLRDIDADIYLMVDGDDIYPAESAWSLLAPIAMGEADMAIGDRLSNGSYEAENKRPFHGLGNNMVRWLIKALYGCTFEDVMTGYRAFSRSFAKTMPVISEGFQIETEISIWAADRHWRVVDVPIDYRGRPPGSESKLSTFADGVLVLQAIASLFRDYRPMAFFGWVALLFGIVGVAVGMPVVFEYVDSGYVGRFPSAVLAIALVLCGALSLTAGLILDTVAKTHRRQWGGKWCMRGRELFSADGFVVKTSQYFCALVEGTS